MPPEPPPLLLTKRLTAFLQSNLSAHVHSALLITPSGKLLAYASPSPASTLRTQATVAAALWAIHAASAPAAPAALPTDENRKPDASETGPTCVTLALAGGVVVIRQLACRLLFVCLGPAASSSSSSAAASAQPSSTSTGDNAAAAAANIANQSQPRAAPPMLARQPSHGAEDGGLPAASPSETGSVAAPSFATTGSTASTAAAAAGQSSAAATATMALARRHAEELARWLDGKLGGLSVPEEGIGVR